MHIRNADFLSVDPQSIDPQVSESPDPKSVVRDSLGVWEEREWIGSSACCLLVCWLYWLLAASHIMMIIITCI